jgi:hypothetical protein
MSCIDTIYATARQLHLVQDTIGLGAEVARALLMYHVCGSCYLTMLALMDFGFVQFSTCVHFIIVAGLCFMVLDTNYYSKRYWSASSTELGTTLSGSNNSLVCHEGHYSNVMTMRSDRAYIGSSSSEKGMGTAARSSSMSQLAGGLSQQQQFQHDRLLHDRPEDMICSLDLNNAFREHIERSLCFESYKFLAEAMTYAKSLYDSPEDQVLLQCLV